MYTFSSIRDHIIPKSLKRSNSVTKSSIPRGEAPNRKCSNPDSCLFLFGRSDKDLLDILSQVQLVNAPDAKALYGCEVPEGLQVKNLARDCSVGAIIIRIGFGCISYYIYRHKEPPKPYSNH